MGRYLASFVKAAVVTDDVQLVVASPSWLRQPILDLFDEHDISTERVLFIGPAEEPLLLRLVRWQERRHKKSLRLEWLIKWRSQLQTRFRPFVRQLGGRLATIRSLSLILALAPVLALVGIAATPLLVILGLVSLILLLFRRILGRLARFGRRLSRSAIRKGVTLARSVVNVQASLLRYFYNVMLDRELELVVEQANKAENVRAWYTTSAIWPSFNKLHRPKLTCFPDLVFMGFPVGFSDPSMGALYFNEKVLETIAGGEHFVTYSQHTKDQVLVEQLSVPEHKVHVVPHAPQDLSHRVTVTHTMDNDAVSLAFCRSQALQALSHASGPTRGQRFPAFEFPFLFYASQIRPSKNVITLLRAYEHLLRRRLIGHKLILTGNGNYLPIRQFVEEKRLERDVLFLSDLSETQLAALYKLADLAVNPTLSEGGMPFTFAEALSVGTPVVMGDIEVTREILVDEGVRAMTLFDPYDWRSMAEKIEWALANRTELYNAQRKFYDDVLVKRGWSDVVAEHFAVMDRIAQIASDAR
ncbi:MAG: glycosyltransferase family 4 protein [Hyphomonadaceae bacterium]|nr:glycosyltransferase family 4 protein [Hyphomonadaceae bacterium]